MHGPQATGNMPCEPAFARHRIGRLAQTGSRKPRKSTTCVNAEPMRTAATATAPSAGYTEPLIIQVPAQRFGRYSQARKGSDKCQRESEQDRSNFPRFVGIQEPEAGVLLALVSAESGNCRNTIA